MQQPSDEHLSGFALVDRFKTLHTPNYAPHPINLVRGDGSLVYDERGKEYIDLAGGIAVSALGHQHPALVAAVQESSRTIWHLSNYWTNEPALQLASALCEATFAERVFFCNSGAEANEAALKLARKYARDRYGARKHRILACNQSFHGRTLFTSTVTGQRKYCADFAPLPPGIDHIDFNDCNALQQQLNDGYCALILEPVQGEGGVIPATREFLQLARELCDAHKVLLIFDEVQSGMGRTGYLYAYQQYALVPDVLTTAKALGCGLPIGAMLTRADIADRLVPGSHGNTAGGNPFVTRVALAGLRAINQPAVLQQVRNMQLAAWRQLTAINAQLHCFDEVRCAGLLIGCALQQDWQVKSQRIIALAAEHGVLLLTAAGGTVLRMAPALNIMPAQLEQGIARLQEALQAAAVE